MRRIFFTLLIAVNLLGCLVSVSLAEDRTIPITFSVTSTGINRFIASQWGSSTKSWNITNQGVWCSIQLQKPTVSLYSNTIKINLAVTVVAIDISTDLPIYVNQTFRFTPTLTIPSTTISMDKIYGQYTDLVAAIAGAIPDTRVQGAVAQALSPINWVIYQGKILNESTARWTESSDIGWKGLPTLTFSVANNEVNLTIAPTIYSLAPEFTCKWYRCDDVNFGISISCNDKFTVDLTDNWLVFTGTIGVKYTVKSTLPAQAIYNTYQNKYIANIYLTIDNPQPNSLLTTSTRIKLKRGNMESLYYIKSNSVEDDCGWYPGWLEAIYGE
jgi:hypothetical protein